MLNARSFQICAGNGVEVGGIGWATDCEISNIADPVTHLLQEAVEVEGWDHDDRGLLNPGGLMVRPEHSAFWRMVSEVLPIIRPWTPILPTVPITMRSAFSSRSLSGIWKLADPLTVWI